MKKRGQWEEWPDPQSCFSPRPSWLLLLTPVEGDQPPNNYTVGKGKASGAPGMGLGDPFGPHFKNSPVDASQEVPNNTQWKLSFLSPHITCFPHRAPAPAARPSSTGSILGPSSLEAFCTDTEVCTLFLNRPPQTREHPCRLYLLPPV